MVLIPEKFSDLLIGLSPGHILHSTAFLFFNLYCKQFQFLFFHFGLVITFLTINVTANYDLFRSEYLTVVNFNEYIQDLISEIISSYSTVSNTVKVNQILVTIS